MINIACYKCGIVFSVPDDWVKYRKQDHDSFWCPNGHSQSFIAESEAEKYQRLYNAESQKLLPLREKLEAEKRAHERTEKKLKRVEKRAAAGVCPCCNRTFKQLAQHMESNHKDFMELQGLKAPKQLKGEVVK